MKYRFQVVKKNPLTLNGEFGVYAFTAKLNKAKRTGLAGSRVVQLKIICGGETLVDYNYGWVSNYRYMSLYKPLVEFLDGGLEDGWKDSKIN